MTESERALITLRNALECATDDVTREDLEFAIQALEKVQQFEAIGTIERFRELTENERKCEDCAGCTNWKCDCANIRNKAIDEFAERMQEKVESFQAEINGFKADVLTLDYFVEFVDEIASQMKGAQT